MFSQKAVSPSTLTGSLSSALSSWSSATRYSTELSASSSLSIAASISAAAPDSAPPVAGGVEPPQPHTATTKTTVRKCRHIVGLRVRELASKQARRLALRIRTVPSQVLHPGRRDIDENPVAAEAVPAEKFLQHCFQISQALAPGAVRHGLAQRPHIHVFEIGQHAPRRQELEEHAENLAHQLGRKIIERQPRNDELVRRLGPEFLDRALVNLRAIGDPSKVSIVIEAVFEDAHKVLVQLYQFEPVFGFQQARDLPRDGAGSRADFQHPAWAGMLLQGARQGARQKAAA